MYPGALVTAALAFGATFVVTSPTPSGGEPGKWTKEMYENFRHGYGYVNVERLPGLRDYSYDMHRTYQFAEERRRIENIEKKAKEEKEKREKGESSSS